MIVQVLEEFPNYSISPEGVVINNVTGTTIVPQVNQMGHLYVTIWKSPGLRFVRTVASLVASVYLENPDEEHFNSLIHLDRDKLNCHAENLAYRPRWFAVEYHRQVRYSPMLPGVAIVNIDTSEGFADIREASLYYGLLEFEVYNKLDQDYGVFPTFHRYVTLM